jgi:two-component system sensor histidine kinase/response regulator
VTEPTAMDATKNLRILVVDDTRSIHADFRKILQPSRDPDPGFAALRSRLFPAPTTPAALPPYELDFATQGHEAFELVRKAVEAGRPYSVAFLDLRMPPGWDGIETCERIWAVDPLIQVVLATAYSDHPWEEIVARLGGNDRLLILKKPFDSVEIRQLAGSLTEKWDLARRVRGQLAELEKRVELKTIDLARANLALQAKVHEITRAEEAARDQATKLEETNRALEQATHRADAANRAKSEFLSNMSHEIRTPMTAILGYAELLCEPGISRTEIEQHVRTIQRNRDHVLKLINDVLDLSKIEVGAMTVERLPCSPATILRDVAGMMELRAAEKHLSLSCGASGPLPGTIRTDPTRLRQVLLNLVANAIKFTDRGGVHVHARMVPAAEGAPPAIAFDVTDTGIGIDAEQLSRLFRPFSQADTSTTRRYGGSGLGLSISLRLAELMGGTIAVRSDTGTGSTFTATVETGPLDGVRWVGLDEVHEAPAEGAPAGGADPTLSGRILLAEDGRDNQRLVKLYLARAGASVEIAEDGSEAHEIELREMAAGTPHDLILMDMQMPRLDGYEATRRLRRDGYRGPILAVTAHAISGDRQRCLDAGCDEYAVKPIDRRALIELCAKLLANPDRVKAPLPTAVAERPPELSGPAAAPGPELPAAG